VIFRHEQSHTRQGFACFGGGSLRAQDSRQSSAAVPAIPSTEAWWPKKRRACNLDCGAAKSTGLVGTPGGGIAPASRGDDLGFWKEGASLLLFPSGSHWPQERKKKKNKSGGGRGLPQRNKAPLFRKRKKKAFAAVWRGQFISKGSEGWPVCLPPPSKPRAIIVVEQRGARCSSPKPGSTNHVVPGLQAEVDGIAVLGASLATKLDSVPLGPIHRKAFLLGGRRRRKPGRSARPRQNLGAKHLGVSFSGRSGAAGAQKSHPCASGVGDHAAGNVY